MFKKVFIFSYVFLCSFFSSAQEYKTHFLDQRCSFRLKGVVPDDEGKKLDDVKLEITILRFDHRKQANTKTYQEIVVDKTLDLFFDDATVVKITAKKQGYHPQDFRASYLELFLSKQSKVESGIASGEIKSPKNQTEVAKLYQDIEYVNESIMLTLREIRSELLEVKGKSVMLKVSKERPISKGFLDDEREGADHDFFLQYVDQSPDLGKPRLILGAPTGGGIIVFGDISNIDSIYEAPESGYEQEVDISNEGDDELFSFVVKTPDGKFGKAKVGLLYFNPDRGEGKILITERAIQLSGLGNRKLETITSK